MERTIPGSPNQPGRTELSEEISRSYGYISGRSAAERIRMQESPGRAQCKIENPKCMEMWSFKSMYTRVTARCLVQQRVLPEGLQFLRI
jgi:hypothetical protein